MRLTEISGTYGRKINMGDYNSAHVEMTLWADIDDGDDPATAAEALRQMARNNVMAELARLQPSLQAKVRNLHMGLPVADDAPELDCGDNEWRDGHAMDNGDK